MIELKCKHCDRYIGKVESIVGEINCPNTSCKAGNQFKVLTGDSAKLFRYTFDSEPKPPKEKPTNPSV